MGSHWSSFSMGMEKVPGGDKANGQPGKETKEVRPQIGSLSAAADHSEQGQTGEQRQQTSLQAGHAALEAPPAKMPTAPNRAVELPMAW